MVEKYVLELIGKAKEAQRIVADFDQQQIDRLVREIGKVTYENREKLAALAHEETGYGTTAMKTMKQASVSLAQWNYLKGKKSVGILEVDEENQIIKCAKPVGVVASITPVTNPTTTATQNTMIAVKSANAVIVGPHPKAKEATKFCVKLMNDAVVAAGGPENLVQAIEEPSLEASAALMKYCDVIVATGGAGMVKAAYSSGKPAYGVGQGNVQTLLDETTDMEMAANTIVTNRFGDFGVPCTGDQTIHIPRAREEEALRAFASAGAYVVTDPEEVDKLRRCAFLENGAPNTELVGRAASVVAEKIGIQGVPDNTKVLLFKLDGTAGVEERLSREILTTVLRYQVYDDFNEMVELARKTLFMEGAGHSSIIFSENSEHIERAGIRLPVGRLLVNQPGSASSGNPFNNGLVPTISLGCGSWGNNSTSDNLSYTHLMNITRISKVIPNAHIPTPEEVFAD